jgi:hypothetical protein
MLAMGLAIAGAPVARAQNQMAANGPGGVSEASTTSAVVESAQASPATPAAQTPAPAVPAGPQPLPTPSMTAPLQTAIPHTFDAGPFGQLKVTGILSGMGLTQGNWVPGDKSTHWDLSNGQIFLQKTDGWWQFYLQAGAYNLPALGTSFLSTGNTMTNLYGPVPQGYVKLVKGNFSVMAGALPTLIGAEYTFSFENMNIERGLLWNQENAVNRGIQLNETIKKLTVSASWNDGFYSNRYTWVTGSLSYAFNSANTLMFVAGGNLGQTPYTTVATPVQNNSEIYELMYTYNHGSWMFEPYYQYTRVPANAKAGIAHGADTSGFAALLNYNFKHGISFAVRPEYISSNGGARAVNLLYGPGSNAWSITLTPTYQNHGFFVRGEFSYVQARSFALGSAFGSAGLNGTQPRGVIEAGFLF